MSRKTDNHNPNAKLALRRHFLNRYHLPATTIKGQRDIRVLDCCQASGRLWGVLRREFAGVEYWGVDVRPKKGRLKIDSVRILDQPGVTQNVIDIDTYGSPFKHWFALLRNVRHSVTVFLTIGLVKIGGGNADSALLEALGLRFRTLKIPNTIGARIAETSVAACIARARDFGFEIAECREAPNAGGNARYIGVRLERV
jgi:hypothetical protein